MAISWLPTPKNRCHLVTRLYLGLFCQYLASNQQIRQNIFLWRQHTYIHRYDIPSNMGKQHLRTGKNTYIRPCCPHAKEAWTTHINQWYTNHSQPSWLSLYTKRYIRCFPPKEEDDWTYWTKISSIKTSRDQYVYHLYSNPNQKMEQVGTLDIMEYIIELQSWTCFLTSFWGDTIVSWGSAKCIPGIVIGWSSKCD